MLDIILAALLLITGVYFTFKTRFVQFTGWRKIMRSFRPGCGGVSPFEALSTALAGSVGTGNIAGVASALAIGGPGALFWMWASALVGMALKYAEVKLAMRYRVRTADGVSGGAMWCVRFGLDKGWRFLAPLFCIGGMLAALSTGCMVQSNTIAAAVSSAVGADSVYIEAAVGLLAAAAVGLVIFRGQRGVIRAASLLVPFMSVLYIAAALVVICLNIERLPGAFYRIVSGALGVRQAAGGIVGFTFMTTLRVGVARGVFTHEAGMGSSPLAHSTAESTPHEQGLMGVLEVFIDTMVLCTLTALMLLCSGVNIPYGDAAADGMALAGAALETGLSVFARPFLAAATALFAYSSILAWSMYGAKCAEYLFGGSGVFLGAFTLAVAAGAVISVATVWRIGEAANALMAIPNLLMLLLLRHKVRLPHIPGACYGIIKASKQKR